MAALLPHIQPVVRGALAALSVICIIFTTLSIFLTLAAGTMQLDGDYPIGPGRLWLSWLSVVRFQGIIPPLSESSGYQVTLHWFLNAFGWEWPEAAWEQSCGIVHNIEGFIPGPGLTLPADLALAASRMRLPEYDYECLGSHGAGFCHNEFLAAWDEANPPPTTFNTVVPLLGYYFAIVLLLSIVVADVVARITPSLARCGCPDFISKRGLCPCLKKGEEMSPTVRNRMRIWNLELLAIVYTFSTVTLLAKGVALTSYLNKVEAQIGTMQMHAGLGAEFLQLSCGTLAAILLAILCLKQREMMGQTASWMEEQGIRDGAARGQDEENSDDDAGTLKI